MSHLAAFGAGGLRFSIPAGADRRALFAALRALPGVADVVLTQELGLVIGGSEDAVTATLDEAHALDAPPPRSHVVPVVYDGEDLAEIARRAGTSREAIVRAHTDHDHTVAMLGFMPGFAYLRGVDPRLVLRRRESPRTRVPAGSVAVAAGYTGIYPFASAGGWHLLGRAKGVAPWSSRGATFAIGDRVRFEAVDATDVTDATDAVDATGATGASADRAATTTLARPHLVATKVAGPVLVVDGGRIGHMHEGVPRGGPLVVSGLARANAALENAPGSAGLEVYGSIELTARGGRVRVADDRSGATTLEDGASLVVASDRASRVRYVAVPGGFDVPEVLGGRGTLLVAKLGGLEGRTLRRGDALAPLGDPASGGDARLGAQAAPELDDAPITITLGPDVIGGDTAAALLSRELRVSAASDRTGTRLEGFDPVSLGVADDARPSAPMVRGAIELTPRGPIVLGADHPTTGGYPVVGVVRASSLDRFFARPVGAVVRFRT